MPLQTVPPQLEIKAAWPVTKRIIGRNEKLPCMTPISRLALYLDPAGNNPQFERSRPASGSVRKQIIRRDKQALLLPAAMQFTDVQLARIAHRIPRQLPGTQHRGGMLPTGARPVTAP